MNDDADVEVVRAASANVRQSDFDDAIEDGLMLLVDNI